MTSDHRSLVDRIQPGGEICAAGLLMLTVPSAAICAIAFFSGATDRFGGIIAFSLASCFLIWIGGRKLWRVGLWVLALRYAGAVLIALGMVTVVTGYHTVHAPYKVWRKTSRDADIDFIIVGCVSVGLSFLCESLLRGFLRSKDSPTRRYRQPR